MGEVGLLFKEIAALKGKNNGTFLGKKILMKIKRHASFRCVTPMHGFL